jgi:hypothetical protein
VDEGADAVGHWFARYHDDGTEAFSGRLLHLDATVFEAAWSDHLAETALHVREVEIATGQTITRIIGTASKDTTTRFTLRHEAEPGLLRTSHAVQLDIPRSLGPPQSVSQEGVYDCRWGTDTVRVIVKDPDLQRIQIQWEHALRKPLPELP